MMIWMTATVLALCDGFWKTDGHFRVSKNIFSKYKLKKSYMIFKNLPAVWRIYCLILYSLSQTPALESSYFLSNS